MALPGLLIEYLVSGAIAYLWVLPLADALLGADASFLSGDVRESPIGIAVLIPLAYVLGMFVDGAAFVLTARTPTKRWSLKRLARYLATKWINFEISEDNVFYDWYLEGSSAGKGDAQENGESRQRRRMRRRGRSARGRIWLHLNAPGLVQEIDSRSSRDRVARGIVVNAIVVTLISGIGGILGSDKALIVIQPSWLMPSVTLGALLMWMMLEAESYRFELWVGEMVRDNLETGEPDDDPQAPRLRIN